MREPDGLLATLQDGPGGGELRSPGGGDELLERYDRSSKAKVSRWPKLLMLAARSGMKALKRFLDRLGIGEVGGSEILMLAEVVA